MHRANSAHEFRQVWENGMAERGDMPGCASERRIRMASDWSRCLHQQQSQHDHWPPGSPGHPPAPPRSGAQAVMLAAMHLQGDEAAERGAVILPQLLRRAARVTSNADAASRACETERAVDQPTPVLRAAGATCCATQPAAATNPPRRPSPASPRQHEPDPSG